VAAIDRVPSYADGDVTIWSGTSVSAPIFASIIALLNNELLAAGKPVLGYLNPRLYTDLAGTFTDITTGKYQSPGLTRPPLITFRLTFQVQATMTVG
jgi:subtilase family serine protease